MIPIRTIEFTVNQPSSVIQNFSLMIRSKNRWGTILNWDFQFNSRLVGYIDKTNSSFILNPVIDRLLGNRPSLISITGRCDGSRANIIRTKLVLSFTGMTSLLCLIVFWPIILLNSTYESDSMIFIAVLTGISIYNLYLLSKDLERSEKQLTELVELAEKAV